MQMNREELLRAYRAMRTIRVFEERLHVEFATGEIPGFVHLYAGEEASAVGVCMHLTARDKIASTHRGHGHCIAKGVWSAPLEAIHLLCSFILEVDYAAEDLQARGDHCEASPG